MKLLTARQVADLYGLPSVRTVATLRGRGLPFLRISKAMLFDPSDVEAFLKSQKEMSCRDETEVRTSNSCVNAGAITYFGAKTGSPDAKAQALKTVEKLKLSLRHSSRSDRDREETGVVLGVRPNTASEMR